MTLISQTASATVSGPDIDAGRVVFQYAADSAGCVVSAGGVANWVSLNGPGQNPSGATHQTTYPLDVDALPCFVPGSTIGFRAHYVTGGGSTHADTHFSPAVDLTTGDGTECAGLNIAASLADGDGTPYPGTSSTWTFRITVRNCTGAPLSGVKVQGGSSGWTSLNGFFTSDSSPQVAVSTKNKTSVLTWLTDLADGEEKYIDVTVAGGIKPNALCSPDPDAPLAGTTLYVSGEWSALAGALKPYSSRVSLVVTCAP